MMTVSGWGWALSVIAALAIVTGQASAQSGDRNGDTQRPPPAHLKSPPAPPLSAEEAVKTLSVPPGFRVEIVASDPLVMDPVAMTIGPDGRIWVVEMRAYMPNVDGKGEDAPIGTVAVLEDTDRDGRMDKRTEFAGGFVLPRAVALVGDGVLVAEPPNLWFLKDRDGDDKADERVQVASDYGNPASPEHTANGLMWALDNWIYSANHTARYRYEAGVWHREVTNFRGQWGITQDDFGRLFYNTNSDPLRMDVVPAEYLRRNRNLVEPRGANVQLARAQELTVWPSRVTIGVNRGYRMLREDGTLPVVTAACGPVIYRGSLFPRDFYGDAFIAEPAGNLVKRAIVDAREGVPSARNAYDRTEFLTSTDERFRPVNLYNGPDGSLYVVDMYRGIIQHRIFITTYLRNQIIERGLETPVGMGRIYRVVPDVVSKSKSKPINLAKLSAVDLVKQLERPDGWRRDTAQRLLVERKDPKSVAPLRTLLQSSTSELARLHAVWVLDGMQALELASVQRALADGDVQVAIAGARGAERWLKQSNRTALDAIAERARWGELAFRRQAAMSIGAAPDSLAEPLLLQLAHESGAQPYMADAIASSAAGRELSMIVKLIDAQPAASPNTHIVPVIASLGAAVLQSNDEPQIARLLDYLSPSSPDWIRSAVLDAVERFIPGEAPKQRVAFLPAEPTRLIEFAKNKSELAARAQAALELLRWKGQKIDTSQALASLTPEQQVMFEKGRKAYATCAACHQENGEGMPGLAPPLVGSRWVNGGVDALARIVLNGKTSGEMTMPPLATLDDETVAAILTYIRRAWGHVADPVSTSQVQWVRSQIENRGEPWTDDELEPMN